MYRLRGAGKQGVPPSPPTLAALSVSRSVSWTQPSCDVTSTAPDGLTPPLPPPGDPVSQLCLACRPTLLLSLQALYAEEGAILSPGHQQLSSH